MNLDDYQTKAVRTASRDGDPQMALADYCARALHGSKP